MNRRRASRAVLSLMAFLLLCACGAERPIPEVDLRLRLQVETEQVELGKGFPLVVERVWSKNLEAEPWEDESLAPLRLQLQEAVRDEDETRVREARRYLAYAFSLADVVIPALPLAATPKAGGKRRLVRARGLRLRVAPGLDPLKAGDPELPSAPPRAPFPWLGLALGLCLLLAAAGGAFVLVRRRRRPPAPSATEAPPPPAHERTLEALRALGAAQPTGPEAIRTDVIRIADLLRDYVGERFDLPARNMTTEELLPDPTLELSPPQRAALSDLLTRCDLVKFAARGPTRAERDVLLEKAETFVSESAQP